MKKQVLLVGSGSYGVVIQESASDLNIDLTAVDGREVDFSSFPGEYVIIATPNFTHFELVSDALKADKHVLCEKPLALSSEEVVALYDLSQSKQRYLGVGFVLPNHSYYQIVKEKQYEFGPIKTVRVYNHAAERELKPEWYWNQKESGGWFMVSEIHWYHLFAWLTGSRKLSVTNASEEKKNDRTIATWCTVVGSHDQSLSIDHRLDMDQDNHWAKIEIVYASGAEIVIDDWVPRAVILPDLKQGREEEETVWIEGKRLATYRNLIRQNIQILLKAESTSLPQEILLAHQAAEASQQQSDKK
jgi:predicted dehydrogenase